MTTNVCNWISKLRSLFNRENTFNHRDIIETSFLSLRFTNIVLNKFPFFFSLHLFKILHEYVCRLDSVVDFYLHETPIDFDPVATVTFVFRYVSFRLISILCSSPMMS